MLKPSLVTATAALLVAGCLGCGGEEHPPLLATLDQGGMRVASFQLETLVLRGTGPEAEAVAGFAIDVFAAIDGTAAPG